MADIVDRLRQWSEFGYGVEATATMKEAAAEIERLRAALREILGWHDYSNDMHKPIEVRAAYMRARAALEEGRT